MGDEILFNDARGAASTLQMAPPFAFSDVKMTVFPLQANLARLTQFCDSYLNQAGHIVQFKPFLPFVYLIILDYGRMSAPAAQTGWVSQREVAFGVPMQWLAPDSQGEMAFKDFAFTTPFIFVDNELSLSTGREVYGWPKLLARLDPRIDEWVKDPHGARRVFEIRSRAAADHVGDDLKAPFLSVTQTPLTGILDFPPNLKSATQAAAAWPNAMAGIARMFRDAGAALGGIAIEKVRKAETLSDLCKLGGTSRIFATDNPARLLTAKHWAEIGDGLRGMFPKLYSNTINLKQFRDAENPMETCYQAITAAKMPIERVGRGGFLGTQNLLMGQIDGGYRVNIINTSTVPVVSQLGLIEAGQQEVDGGVLSSFAPVCPFWIEIDMIYNLGETIAMRTRSGAWQLPEDRRPDQPADAEIDALADRRSAAPIATETAGQGKTSAPDDGAPEEAEKGAAEVIDEALSDLNSVLKDLYLIEASNPFNTTRGASEALGGVFRMKNGRIRVLPLLADPDVLNSFVENYIQVPGHMHVTAWGRHVYMLSTQYESISSDLMPGKTSNACEVTFAVPVKCYDWPDGRSFEMDQPDGLEDFRGERWQNGAANLIGTGMIAPFSYVDDITAAITESEVFGVPTLRSEIVSPPEGWAAATAEKGILLQARAIVVPALGSGAEGTRKTLVEVRDTPMIDPADTAAWQQIAPAWGDRLAEDLLGKMYERQFDEEDLKEEFVDPPRPFRWGRAMALRILGGLHGVNTLSLKQFRDASTPQNACYQGVVTRGTAIENLHGLEEIDRDLTVSITRYPTQPIAETLGLIPKRTVVGLDGVRDEFEPLRPFELHADLISRGGKTLFERSAGAEWNLINLPDGPLGWRPASDSDVDRALREKETEPGQPTPKISYVRLDAETERSGRLKPLRLDADQHKAFRNDVRERNARDTLILWRGVKLGTLADSSVLQAVDDCQIDDIHGFVRTRPNADGSGDGGERVFELAGCLEFITPATILDAILSRGWAARKSGASEYRIQSRDFRVRRGTLGPALADCLFPARESQDGFWPHSLEHRFSASLRDAIIESSLPHEFRKFLYAATLAEEKMKEARSIAKRTLPDWFYRSAFDEESVLDQIFADTPPWLKTEDHEALKSAASMMGVWPVRYKLELRSGVAAFFREVMEFVDGDEDMETQVRYFGREWLRLTERLLSEAVPDEFGEGDQLDLDYLEQSEDMKTTLPGAGWLHARLEMIASNQTYTLEEIKDRAEDWTDAISERWEGE